MSGTLNKLSVLEDLESKDIETSKDVKVYSTFENMNIKKEIIQGIYAYGMWIFIAK